MFTQGNVMTTYDLIMTKAYNEGFEVGIQKGIEMGIKKGIEKGKIEGKIKVKIQIILNAHAKGLDLALIANITDMSEEEVIQIMKEHGRLE